MTDKTGVRQPEYLRSLALNRLEDLMIQAMPWSRIVAILAAEGYTESEATAKNWRQEIQRRWAAEDEEARPARKDAWRLRLEARFTKMCAAADAIDPVQDPRGRALLEREATRIGTVAIALDGLAAPVAIKHEGRVDVAAMSPAERAREIAELLAKRDAVQRAAGGKAVH